MPIDDAQITNKNHAVPQNIMDVEFKIIGSLTMRQFFYIAGCSGIAYLVYISYASFLKWPIILFFGLLGLGLAFVPIQDRGLDQWIINFFKAIYSPNQRIWQKDPQIPFAFEYQSMDVVRQELITLTPTTSRRKLEKFLDTQGRQIKEDPLDIPQARYAQKVADAFSAFAFQATAPVIAPVGTQTVVTPTVPTVTPAPTYTTPLPQTPPSSTPVSEPQPTPPSEQKEELLLPKPQEAPLDPITPDQHSGRFFTNLLPKMGVIKLPVRGEKIFKTTEETELEEDITEKAQQLQALLTEIKQSDSYKELETKTQPQPEIKYTKIPPTPPMQTQPATPAAAPIVTQTNYAPTQPEPQRIAAQPAQKVDDQVKATLEALKIENNRLENQIKKLQAELAKASAPEEKKQKQETITKLEEEHRESSKRYEGIKARLEELQEKVFVKKAVSQEMEQAQEVIKGERPQYDDISPVSATANVVLGTVMGPDQKVLENVVLIIKNQQGEPVRALKTNQLGEFKISTPLSNGIYTLEVDKTKKTSFGFDIIRIEANGQVLSPIYIMGKN